MLQEIQNQKLRSVILDQIPGIQYGFGTADDPVSTEIREIWDKQKPIWKQVHGIEVAHVQRPGQDCGKVDALYTEVSQVPVGVITADCVPIVMAERSGQCVAALHAGWRGTKQQIVQGVWTELRSRGHQPKNWVAVIGPSIRPCCYEVSESLIQDFVQTFPDLDPKKIAPQFRRLDLAQVNRHELEKIGVSTIEVMPLCTFCHQMPRFHSYRRDSFGGQGSVPLGTGNIRVDESRQYSIVMRD